MKPRVAHIDPRWQVSSAGTSITDREIVLQRIMRRRELTGFSGLKLACQIIDYGLRLTEDCDPIEVILDYEFNAFCNFENEDN